MEKQFKINGMETEVENTGLRSLAINAVRDGFRYRALVDYGNADVTIRVFRVDIHNSLYEIAIFVSFEDEPTKLILPSRKDHLVSSLLDITASMELIRAVCAELGYINKDEFLDLEV